MLSIKEIFIYVGSRLGDKSKTLKFINNVLDEVYNSIGHDKVKVTTYTAKDTKINRCEGCLGCFLTGKCSLDKEDDMKTIKDNMLRSDIIILATPVYVHNVSGDMKIFIDRISYWTHLMRLSGKIGIVASTSGGNGLELVNNYLYKIMTYMGVKIKGKFGVCEDNIDENYIKSVEKFSRVIIEYIKGKKVETDDILEAVFKATKNTMEKLRPYKSAEFQYWKESKLIECNSFKEVLEMLR
ncbi:flavodoxin family protein [Clostridium oceanicum]|uniref:NADPH-dependent FMN reductase-like domain-containing protein n=1 Tax=Clostridium oceanicum TaxID=1543 RepID=A0ABN1JXE5_9CLOT